MEFFWQYYAIGMTVLASTSLALTCVVFGLSTFSHYLIRRIKDLPPPEPEMRLPRVSLVAPARNEERNIEQAVRSLLTLDYPDLQITLVNDRSTDGTGEILARLAAENPRLNVVNITELPAGWLGKNHAMQLGAGHSDGEWILFTDADIIFEPTVLKRTMRYALENGIDHLAAAPDTRMPSWMLQSFVVTFSMMFMLFVRAWSIRNPQSTAHVGIGAFNLIRVDVFRAIDGMRPIAMRPDDDLKLGKLVKLSGYRQDLVNGLGGMVVVEWYASVRELTLGLEKNMFAALNYNLFAAMFVSGTMLLFNIWPFIAPFLTSGLARWLYVADVALLLFLAMRSAWHIGVPISRGLGYPLAILLFVFISWRSIFLTYWRNGIRWRDTHYSLAELRANRM